MVEIFGLFFSFFLVCLIICGIILAARSENKKWNNGGCPYCEKGFWKSFDVDSGGAIGYRCTNCNSTTWQSYNKRLK